MRGGVIGLVIGAVIGIVVGVTVVAPRSLQRQPEPAGKEAAAPRTEPPVEFAAKSEPPPPAKPGAVQWRLASAYATALPQLGPLVQRLDKNLWRVSDGTFGIKFHEPGVLVGSEEMFDAVATGKVDAVFASPSQWSARIPALQIFGGVPFGPDGPELLAWYEFGGGRQFHQDAYAKHNLFALPCGITGAEGGGWTRRQIRSLADLQGLRLAAVGLPARVLARVGADPKPLRGADIFAALDSSELDGVGFSTPAIDAKAGFRRQLRHYHFPAWHRPAGFHDLAINLDRWKALSATQRLQVETVCGDNLRFGLAEGEAAQFPALKEMQAKNVKLHHWPAEVLGALRKAWKQVATEETGADPLFHETWQSLDEFREDHAIWRELGYLAPE
ncbi:MAG: TRAP transporter substrate-binding protein [Magnetospirillum sp. WYHS-4]